MHNIGIILTINYNWLLPFCKKINKKPKNTNVKQVNVVLIMIFLCKKIIKKRLTSVFGSLFGDCEVTNHSQS